MDNIRVTRRQFMRDSAIAAAGVAMGLGAISQTNKAVGASAVNTSKILNYNPNMEYRRQGKTNLMVSAVCLGGHSRSNQAERNEIVSRCIDIGINYIDACTAGEVKRVSKELGLKDWSKLTEPTVSEEEASTILNVVNTQGMDIPLEDCT